MSLHRPCAGVTTLLFIVISFLPAYPQGETGAVHDQPAATAPKDPKALPWKFLASPMGVLDPKDWPNDTFLKQFPSPESWDCNNKTDCTPKSVKALVRKTLGVNLDDPKAKPVYVAIHVADYGSGADNRMSDAWYLYHSNDKKWTFAKFTSQRLYGSPSVLFLFVHLNVKAVTLGEARKQLTEALARAQTQLPSNVTNEDEVKKLKQKLQDSGQDPTFVATLVRADTLNRNGAISLDQAIKSNAIAVPSSSDPSLSIKIPIQESTKGEQFRWLNDFGIPTSYANVRYESAVVKRTPANIANLLSVLKLLGLAQGAQKAISISADETATVWGAGQIGNIGLPSDVSIAGYRKEAGLPLTDDERTQLQIGAQGDFNDEQLYWWDASIGIPVHKIRDLNYSVDNNTVIATQVDKQSAYAFFNLMVHPVDLSNPKDNVWPRILVGFPLSSSPWDRLFAGAGVGIPLKPLRNFQFFAGATFNRSKQPQTLAPGDPANNGQLQSDLKIKMTPKFTFGINVPVLSVFDKLMGK